MASKPTTRSRTTRVARPARRSDASGNGQAAPNTRLAGVILCGGKGTRMGQTRAHKVCVPLAGRPAIVRLMDTLRAEGVDPLVIVVGHRAGDVIETVGALHPGVHFVYQRDRLGTGHAARIGVEALTDLGYRGSVLVTMGDKWLAPGLVNAAFARFHAAGADLLAVSTPKRPESTAGRIVHIPGGGIGGIVEVRDIQRARLLTEWSALATGHDVLRRAELLRAGLRWIRPASKLWRALGPLAGFARGRGTVRGPELTQALRETGVKITVGGHCLDAAEVERHSTTVNESVYIARIEVLEQALRRVGRCNAQDEFYLTDVLELISRGLDGGGPRSEQVIEHRLEGKDVMAFNTRTELRRIEEHVLELERARPQTGLRGTAARCLHTPVWWRDFLDPSSPRARRVIERTYGVGGPLVPERLHALRRVVRLFAQTYGADRRVFLVRAPGRINLMGRHIDHQGGHVHVMALDCEVVMAVSPRRDDVIRLVNADPVVFPARELVLNDWLSALRAPDWLSFVDGPAVRSHLLSTAGDWSNYVLAPALFQQFHRPQQRLRGMDVAVYGNVLMAAGLSSSSSVVVAAMEAVNAVNGFEIAPEEVVSSCGQAEWFVGSRGGAADHAAIRLGRAGHAARMTFHPFKITGYVPIPPEAAVLVAFSGQRAVKSAGARDRYNERVACYRLGILLLKRRYPRLAPRLEHIRDVAPHRLGTTAPEVLRMIGALPNDVTRSELRRQLGSVGQDDLARIFASHRELGGYTVRDVVAFGVGECERSRVAAELLSRGDLSGFGELMLRSHDGDRVNGQPAFPDPMTSGQTAQTSVPLQSLIGGYACSTPDIDELVDLTRSLPGVYGAQLAGAGLGGCVMVLADRSVVRRVCATLAKDYYEPRGMSPAIWHVRSVSGGGLIEA